MPIESVEMLLRSLKLSLNWSQLVRKMSLSRACLLGILAVRLRKKRALMRNGYAESGGSLFAKTAAGHCDTLVPGLLIWARNPLCVNQSRRGNTGRAATDVGVSRSSCQYDEWKIHCLDERNRRWRESLIVPEAYGAL